VNRRGARILRVAGLVVAASLSLAGCRANEGAPPQHSATPRSTPSTTQSSPSLGSVSPTAVSPSPRISTPARADEVFTTLAARGYGSCELGGSEGGIEIYYCPRGGNPIAAEVWVGAPGDIEVTVGVMAALGTDGCVLWDVGQDWFVVGRYSANGKVRAAREEAEALGTKMLGCAG